MNKFPQKGGILFIYLYTQFSERSQLHFVINDFCIFQPRFKTWDLFNSKDFVIPKCFRICQILVNPILMNSKCSVFRYFHISLFYCRRLHQRIRYDTADIVILQAFVAMHTFFLVYAYIGINRQCPRRTL